MIYNPTKEFILSDQDVFDANAADQQPTEQVAPLNGDDDVATMLSSIVREDGTPKYKDVNTALKSLSESQAHISRIENENRELRAREEELSRKAIEADTLQSIVDRLTNGTPTPKESTPPAGKEPSSDATVEQQIEKALKAREEQARAKTNLENVNNEILKKFGEKSNEVVKAKADDLGITLDEFKMLAAKSPKLVLGHFSISSTPATPSSTQSSVNTTGMKSSEPELKRPERSVLSGPGANTEHAVAHLREIRERVYKEHGVTG